MNNLWNDFKNFAFKGNVLDLAVGIIIGAAFTSVVGSLVKDILMPPIGLVLGGVDFSNLFIALSQPEGVNMATIKTVEQAASAGVVTLNIGLFLNAVINFLIVAMAVFLLVRAVTRATSKPAPVEEAPAPDPMLESQKALIAAIDQLRQTMEKR